MDDIFVNSGGWGRGLAGRRPASKLVRRLPCESILSSDLPRGPSHPQGTGGDVRDHRAARGATRRRAHGRLGALRTPEDNDVPWWRVINAAGRISFRDRITARSCSAPLLLREGVRFTPGGGGAVNLGTYGWPSEAYDSAVASHKRAASRRRSRRLKGLRT